VLYGRGGLCEERIQMTKSIVKANGNKRKHKIVGTIIRSEGWKGHVIGQVIDRVGHKDVSGRTGFIHVPEEAIAFSIDALKFMQAAGAEYVDVLNTDNGIHYRTEIQNYFEHGEKFCYGKWGEQLKLTLPNFTQSRDPEYMANTSTDGTQNEYEVKPLNYSSRATVGVVWNGVKQLSLFGGK
jgi:hypothetical protein